MLVSVMYLAKSKPEIFTSKRVMEVIWHLSPLTFVEDTQ